MLLNQPCAFVDIETTGTHASRDAITEIGLRLVDVTGEIVTWQRLINPGRSIPDYIQSLTGINNAMVDDQPYFDEIAPELFELLDGVVFVAHNARFDYSFIRAGLEHCGYSFKPKSVCTVKLSRTLYPKYKRHNLDAICDRINYQVEERHRALGDVDAMMAFVLQAIQEHGLDRVNHAAQQQLKRPSQPVFIDNETIDAIPNTPGVYRFYDEDNALLYVGKSVELRKRVQAHFSADIRDAKEMKLSQQVRHIDYTETLGELGALLLENHEIKTLQPIYNRRQRHYKKLWSFELTPNKQPQFNGALQAKLSERPVFQQRHIDESQNNSVASHAAFNHELYGLYSTKSAADKWFKKIVIDSQLCKKVLGLEKGKGRCFNYQLKRCAGACVGEESISAHNLRLREALSSNTLLAWPFNEPAIITEESTDWRDGDEPPRTYHVIDQWAHLGSTRNLSEIESLLDSPTQVAFDRETYRFLNRYIHTARPVSEFELS